MPIPMPCPRCMPLMGGASGSVMPRAFARFCISAWCCARIFSRSASDFAASMRVWYSFRSAGVISWLPYIMPRHSTAGSPAGWRGWASARPDAIASAAPIRHETVNLSALDMTVSRSFAWVQPYAKRGGDPLPQIKCHGVTANTIEYMPQTRSCQTCNASFHDAVSTRRARACHAGRPGCP
ncbi:hypothetical protein BDI4_1280008 [Burkholderia diffusa]|nr:hypothetical protein BDI4_1280008 [Burkholderia diffusa]